MTATRMKGSTGLRIAVALLLIAAVILSIIVVRKGPPIEEVSARNGDVVPLSELVPAPVNSVRVPFAEVRIAIGRPFPRMDWADVTGDYDPRAADSEDGEATSRPPDILTAPEGGTLVPVSWDFIPRQGWPDAPGRAAITLRLVNADQRIEIFSAAHRDISIIDPEAVVVAVEGQSEDWAVEVEYDGVVQRLEAASGEVETGAAQGLYDTKTYATHCAALFTNCYFSAASPSQALVSSDVDFLASDVSTYGYDSELGWPPEGTVWVSSSIQTFIGTAYDSAGRSFQIYPSTRIVRAQLIGRDGSVLEPTLNDVGRLTTTRGRVVFAVPTDVEPQTLVLRQRAKLEDDPRRVPLVARVPLT